MHRATSKSLPAHNSWCLVCGVRHRTGGQARAGLLLLSVALNCGLCFRTMAGPEEPAARAFKTHAEARAEAAAHPDDAQHAWELGRACFDLAEFATNNTQRAALAREGIGACEQALSLTSTSAPARYYLGMNRGQLARASTLGALKLVDRMERDFLAARALDETFDEAGPDRNLGLLYLQAPGWPISVGNQRKARAHLKRAAELAPAYPENRLNLMEALAGWRESDALQHQYEAWVAGRTEAEQRYSGDRWHRDWQQWELRLELLRRHLPETSASSGTVMN